MGFFDMIELNDSLEQTAGAPVPQVEQAYPAVSSEQNSIRSPCLNTAISDTGIIDQIQHEERAPALLPRMSRYQKFQTSHSKEYKRLNASLPWIRENIQTLLASGWTRLEIFKRGRFRYPSRWGIAWLSVWERRDLSISIEPLAGAICFSFTEATGKTISQKAYRESVDNHRKTGSRQPVASALSADILSNGDDWGQQKIYR